MDKFSDIIIIGAGPAGLSFASEFKDSKLNLIIIEKSNLKNLKNPLFDGREIALTHTSRNILKKLSILDRINPDEIHPLNEAKVINGLSDYQLHFPSPKENSNKEKIDCLGYLISNNLIRKAAFENVEDLNNVELITNKSAVDVHVDQNIASVILDDGTKISAKLLICTDSRLSLTRQKLGIATDIHNFARTVIVFRIKHSLSNEHTAKECFFYGMTLAILPLKENLSSVVITINSNQTDTILNQNSNELALFIYNKLNGELGEIEVISKLYTYPLIGTHARKFYSTRSALIGDTAVGMHPVTAHGFNLGLQGANILAKIIRKAEKNNQDDVGAKRILEEYNFKHMLNTKPLYHGTNILVKLFTSESKPVKVLRSSVLRISNNIPIIKNIISKQLTG